MPRLFVLTISEIEKCLILGLTKCIEIFVTLFLLGKLTILTYLKNILIDFTIAETVPGTHTKKELSKEFYEF